MKESEAKTKWCPMVRHLVGNDTEEGSGNRIGLDMNPEISRCIASGCMMWEPEYEFEDKEKKPDEEVPEGWYAVNSKILRRYYPSDRGDCGLKSKEQGCGYPG